MPFQQITPSPINTIANIKPIFVNVLDICCIQFDKLRDYFPFLIMPVINIPIDIPYNIPITKSLMLDILFKTIASTRNNIPTGI